MEAPRELIFSQNENYVECPGRRGEPCVVFAVVRSDHDPFLGKVIR